MTERTSKADARHDDGSVRRRDAIETSDLIGLRDRALIGVMGYIFARVSAAGTLRVEDYFQPGRRSWLRLHEKTTVSENQVGGLPTGSTGSGIV